MKKKIINPKSVFNSLKYGFSQAVEFEGGRRVVISGQVGVDSEEKIVNNNLTSQTKAAIDNIEQILIEIGGNLTHVVMLRIYIVDSEKGNQTVISKNLLERFPKNPPATSWIFVSGLSMPEWLIEIEAEAVLPENM